MRLFTKIYLAFIGGVILLQLASVCFFVAVPIAHAATAADGSKTDIRNPELVVPFNNFKDLGAVTEQPCYNEEIAAQKGIAKADIPTCLVIPWLVTYISNAYRYSVVIGSIMAVVMLMIGGLMYMMAGLNQSLVGRAKEYMVGAATGLALLLGSYMLLNVINPNLVRLQPIKVEILKPAMLMEGSFCTQAENQGFVVTGEWKKGEACGKDFNMTAGPRLKDQKVGKQTCIADWCPAPLVCVQDLQTQAYGCSNVIIHGTITIPGLLTDFVCGLTARDAVTSWLNSNKKPDSFFIDSVRLMYRPLASDSGWNPLTNEIKLQPRTNEQSAYSIKASDLLPGKSLDLAVFLTLPSTQVALEIVIYDASSLMPSANKIFIVAPDVHTANSVKPVVACGSFGKVVVFQRTGSGEDIVKDWEKITADNWFGVGKLRDAHGGIKWNINVTDDFFSCKDGAIVSQKGICSTLLNLAENQLGTAIGGACSNDSECIGEAECVKSSWYATGQQQQQLCQCTTDGQCGQGKKCIKVKEGCGWNYCIVADAKVESVPKDFNPFHPPEVPDKSKGLCMSNSECALGDCDGGWGYNSCDACK